MPLLVVPRAVKGTLALRAPEELNVAIPVFTTANAALLRLLRRTLAELEPELIQSQMAQMPLLRGEVGARALRVWSVSREGVWASAGVQGAWVSGCGCGAD